VPTFVIYISPLNPFVIHVNQCMAHIFYTEPVNWLTVSQKRV